MRASMVAVALTLCLAAPAGAGPITLEFKGVVHTIAPLVATHVAPQLTVGDPFSALLTLSAQGSLSQMSFGIGSIRGSAVCAGCTTSSFGGLSAGTLSLMPGAVVGPPTQWALNGWFAQSLFSLTLNGGWQSGSMFIWLENAFIGGGVNGRITSMRVLAQSVPEPGTLALFAVGLGAATLATRMPRFRRKPVGAPPV